MVPSYAPPRGLQPIRLALVFLGGAIVLSYAFAMMHHLPPDQLSAADRGLLSLAGWAGIALVAADFLRSTDSIDRLLRRLTVLGSVVASVGFVQFFSGVDLAGLIKIPGLTSTVTTLYSANEAGIRRVASTASHPIEFGMVLALILPFAFHIATHATEKRGRWWVMTTIIAVAVPMSVSRSAILGLAVELIILFVSWTPRRRLGAIVIAPVFIVGMRVLIPGLVGTISSIFGNASTDPSLQGRTDDYAVVGQFITRSPLVGRGFGTFLPTDFFFLDNQYLGIIIEVGFVGFAALLTLLIVGMALGRGIRVRSTDERSRDLGQCFIAVFAAAAVGMGTFDALGFSMFTGTLFLLLGVAGARWRLARSARPSALTPRARLEPSR
jgi:O-antigen ligase